MSKPPPFKRNSIEMGRHGRGWKYVRASELRKGDVVKDLGLIVVGSWPIPDTEHTKGFTKWTTVEFVSGYIEDYLLDEEVFAFVRIDNG